MMNIIGHRGAAGLELENTKTSFIRAMNIGLHSVELDVRKTKDGKLVVCHDADLTRLAHTNEKIRDLSLAELQQIPLINGTHILTLEEALTLLEGLHIIVEIKDEGCGRELLRVLKPFRSQSIIIASFKLRELVIYQQLGIQSKLYAVEHTKPFDIIHYAKRFRFDGIGLNFWLLNPLTYFLCKKAGLRIFVYTVNDLFMARWISWLYPQVAICTDYPNKFLRSDE